MLSRIWHGRLMGLRVILLTAAMALVLIGLISIATTQGLDSGFFQKHLRFHLLGIAALVAVNLIPYPKFGRWSYFLFGLSLVMLGLVLAGKYLHFGGLVPSVRGACRWLNLIPYVPASRFQPSEITKLTYILALAWYLRHRSNYRTLPGLIGPFALTLVPMVLILKQPDLGTVLLFVPVLFMVLFAAGARLKHLLTIIFIGLLLSPGFYLIMEEYQLERIQVLLKQNTDDPYWVLGPGYQLRQSKIHIATGGVTGQNPEENPHLRYRNLPDSHNDFIFAPITHQWGFLGGMTLLVLYSIILFAGIEIAAHQSDPFGRLIAVGVTTLIAAQTFINIGMTMGLMPVTGMTLPFVSYGGSSLLANFLTLGILINVARYRPPLVAKKAFEFDD